MAPTIRVLADRADRPDDLVAAGEVLELRFRDNGKSLSLRASKLLHLAIKNAGPLAGDDIEHRVPLRYVRAICHFGADDVVEGLRELVGTVVELRIRTPAGRERVMVDPLIHSVERPLRGEGDDELDTAVTYRLSRTLRRVLQQSNSWAVLSRKCLLAFESRYSIRLYEILSLRQGMTRKVSETFSLDDLRQRLGVPAGTFKLWADLRRFVIERAIGEVNQLSSMDVSFEPIRRGRAVTAVQLAWRRKDASGRAAAETELDRHRTGRKARRAGAVEVVVEPPTVSQNCDTATDQPPGRFANASKPTDTPPGEVDVPADVVLTKISRHEPASPQPAPRGVDKPPATKPAPRVVRAFPDAGPIGHGRWGTLAREHLPPPRADPDVVAQRFRAWASGKGIGLDAASIEAAFIGFCRGFRL